MQKNVQEMSSKWKLLENRSPVLSCCLSPGLVFSSSCRWAKFGTIFTPSCVDFLQTEMDVSLLLSRQNNLDMVFREEGKWKGGAARTASGNSLPFMYPTKKKKTLPCMMVTRCFSFSVTKRNDLSSSLLGWAWWQNDRHILYETLFLILFSPICCIGHY